MQQFASTKRRDEYAASRVLAKQCAAEFTDSRPEDWYIERSQTGAPKLCRHGQAEQNLHISISHSKFYCAATVANHAIGLDLQFIETLERWRAIETRVFSSSELTAIKSLPNDLQSRAYSEIWALKEAHGKFNGQGLQIRSIRNCSFICAEDVTQGFQALTINLGSHMLAIFTGNLAELTKQQAVLCKDIKAWRIEGESKA
jgi:phosphopantetheinyl transferase